MRISTAGKIACIISLGLFATSNSQAASGTGRGRIIRDTQERAEETEVEDAVDSDAARAVGSGVRTARKGSPSGKSLQTRQTSAMAREGTLRASHANSAFLPGGQAGRSYESHSPVPQVARRQPRMLFDSPEEIRSKSADSSEPLILDDDVHELDDFHVVDDCCGRGCGVCATCCIPCPRIPWENMLIFGGVQGFTGPPNRGETGSFGFHEGASIGAPLPLTPCGELGWQLGVRTTQNNLSGSSLSNLERDQTFLTGGLFGRVDWGLQGGVVVDWLNESWYFSGDFLQLRGELSWMFPCRHETGFWFSSGSSDKQVRSTFTSVGQVVNLNEEYSATDLYAFYYRRRFGDCEESTGRIFAGFSGEGDGFIGADANVTITDNWGFQAGFSYLVPGEAKGAGIAAGHGQEGWNLSLSLVLTPGSLKQKNYFRPLFNVADNGNFMLDRR